MKIAELDENLKRDGFTSSYYSFDRKKPPAEGYVLERVDGRWVVFYSERGELRDIANFLNETDACKYFYRHMHDSYDSVLNKSRH